LVREENPESSAIEDWPEAKERLQCTKTFH
jgi:hypothetical protein